MLKQVQHMVQGDKASRSISATPFTTISAIFNLSRPYVFVTATQRIPAAFAASMPAMESSIIKQSAVVIGWLLISFNLASALLKHSGFGLPSLTSSALTIISYAVFCLKKKKKNIYI